MTDKLRDAAQQALARMEQDYDIACETEEGGEASEYCVGLLSDISALRAALTQQDAQAVPVGAIERVRKALAGRKFRETTDLEDLLRMAANVIAEDGSVIGHMKAKISAPTPPAQQDAQQDAQAVPHEPCAVVKWQTGGPVVHIIGEVQVGDLLYRAAPTPPAQRVMLTPEEMTKVIVHCYGYSADIEFHECLARAAIEAYERKNGLRI